MDDDELLAAAAEVLLRRAARRSAPSLTVAALYAQYEAANKHRPAWWAARNKVIGFVTALGSREAGELRVSDWTAYAQARLQTPVPPKRKSCYSAATVNVELGAAKTLMNWGVTQGLLRYNPIAVAKPLKGAHKRDTAPMEQEIGRALSACQTQGQVVLVLAAADVALRRDEIRQLQHDWIDGERKVVKLPNWACKGKRGGTVPCTQRFIDACAAMPRHIRHPQVLVSSFGAGGAYRGAALDNWWIEIRDRAGLVPAPGDRAVHLHDLRAAAATNALERGVSLQIISKVILRHSSLAVTERYLRRRAVGNLEAAIEAMEAGIVRDQRKGPKRSPEEKIATQRGATEQTSGSEHT